MKKILVALLLLAGCADEPVRWTVDDPILQSHAFTASEYWGNRGEEVGPSADPNTRVMADASLTVPAHATWDKDALGRISCVIRYNADILLAPGYPRGTVAGILAHEFGHCLGYRHVNSCGIMNGERSECVVLPKDSAESAQVR